MHLRLLRHATLELHFGGRRRLDAGVTLGVAGPGRERFPA